MILDFTTETQRTHRDAERNSRRTSVLPLCLCGEIFLSPRTNLRPTIKSKIPRKAETNFALVPLTDRSNYIFQGEKT
jgi:hypothetical protein